MKAKLMTGLTKRRKNSGGRKFHLVYVGNVHGNQRSGWPWAGVTLRLKDVFKRIPKNAKQKAKIRKRQGVTWGVAKRKSRKNLVITDKSSKNDLAYTLLRVGLQLGDTFFVYHSGEPVVVRKQDTGAGYYLATPTDTELKEVMSGIKEIRRNLRWSYGSFCHGVPSQVELKVDPDKRIIK